MRFSALKTRGSLLVQQLQTLFGEVISLPLSLMELAVELSIVILTKVQIFALALASVFLGIWISPYLGLAVFFGVFGVLRLMAEWVTYLGTKIEASSGVKGIYD